MNDTFLKKYLEDRATANSLRVLPSSAGSLVDFSSNDYLGFSTAKELEGLVEEELLTNSHLFSSVYGSTGSRLLTGNSTYAESLESFIAQFHNSEASLLFNSGYMANVGLLSSIATQNDVILYDELSHASIYDGIRLSRADSFPFLHNNVTHLEERLMHNQTKSKRCFVVVESVYSMNGDFSPLAELCTLCEKYNACLIVDEAHAVGVFGIQGEGRVVELNLSNYVFARVVTFGKALGCHGAAVLGSNDLKQYLVNYSRPFIYTTALPAYSLLHIKCAYKLLSISRDKIQFVTSLIKLFKEVNVEYIGGSLLQSNSAIQSYVLPGNDIVKKIARLIQADGLDVRSILSPTVPKGKERIRVILHAFNTSDQVNRLALSFKRHSALLHDMKLV